MRTLLVQLAVSFCPARRVARAGAAWCDRNETGWAGYVDPDLINIRSQIFCVLGQVGGYRYGHGNGYAELAVKHQLPARRLIRLGFFPTGSTARLNAAWAAEVRARRAADDAVLAEAAGVLAGAGLAVRISACP